MQIAIPLTVLVGLVPVVYALFGAGLFRWLSLASAALMLFGLVAPPAAIVAWLVAMFFAIAARRAKQNRQALQRFAQVRAAQDRQTIGGEPDGAKLHRRWPGLSKK